MRTQAEQICRCDVCGLLRPKHTQEWKQIEVTVNSGPDCYQQDVRIRWREHYTDLCPSCHEKMLQRIKDAFNWATTL